MEENYKSPFEVVKLLILHLFLIFLSQIILVIILKVSIYFVIFQTQIPEDFIHLEENQRVVVQKELIEKFQEEAKRNPEKFHRQYMNLSITEKPGLLFWDRILWGVAFLIPGFLLIRRNGGDPNRLGDELSIASIGPGIVGGFSIFFIVLAVSLVLLIFGVKPKGPEFQQMLFMNLKGNTYLLSWAIYSVGIITGIMEELFFRGYLLNHYKKAGFEKAGLVITSVFFGILHYSPEASFFVPLILTVVGGLFGYFYLKTGNIWVSVSAHAAYNSIGLCFAYFLGDKMTG